MQALVFSDIHGSTSSAKFIQQLVAEKSPDAIILLGDILYHGPRNPIPSDYDPPAVAAILNTFANMIIAVQGNCDSEVDCHVLSFPIAPLFSWIYADGVRLFITHGHHYHPDALPPLREGDVFLYGHTHVPAADIREGIYLCNPGSLTLPKEGHPPCYGTFSNGTFSVISKESETYLSLIYC